MVKFLDEKMQKQHFEDLKQKNSQKLSEEQKDFILFMRLKEEQEAGLA